MSRLIDLKSKYVQQLQSELASIEKATASFEISLKGVQLQTNAPEINGKIQGISQSINKQFVEELNISSYETEFSDQERLDCYADFRAECGAIIAKFTAVGLSMD